MSDYLTVIRMPYPVGTNPPRHIVNTLGRVDLGLAEMAHTDTGRPRDYAAVVRRDTLDVVAFRDDLARGLLAGDHAARLVTRLPATALADTGPGGRYLRLVFTTPTHFRIAGLDHLLPEAALLFGALAERWTALGWPELPKPDVKRVPAAFLRYQLTTATIKRVQVSAFTGAVEYDLLPCDDDGRRMLWILARFAEYRGVGAHTSYGLGRVRLATVGVSIAGSVWDRQSQGADAKEWTNQP